MSAITWSDVAAIAPALASVDVLAQAMILNMVNVGLVVDEFDGESGPNLKLARVYLAAHVATVNGFGDAGTSGPAVMDHAGGLTVQYANAAASSGVAALLDLSPYGRMYRLILMRSPARCPRVP